MNLLFSLFTCFFIISQSVQPFFINHRQHTKKVHVPPAQFFTQELDHFNPQDRRTFNQRFFVNDSYFNSDLGGPIFFELGGEGALGGDDVVDLMMVNFAQQEGALLVALEHRYYGASLPLDSLSTENLQYLSSEQALADASLFLTAFKLKYPTAGDIITFGGSYPGALAAWFRLKYPHITLGAVASSAPVQAELDMTQYLDVVGESLTKIAGIQCDASIAEATKQIETMLQTPSGKTTLSKLFTTCSPIETPEDIATFMSNLMGNWMETVQYDTDLPSKLNITALCEMMDNSSKPVLNRYVDVANSYLNPQQPCLDVSYTQMIQQLQNTTATSGPSVGARQWTYQTCVEFGYFQSTDSPNQPFGTLVPLSYYTNMCRDIFGFDWLPRINETNTHYGGKHPEGTNVLFVNGSLDPWHSLSVTKSLSNTVTAVYIEGTSHCADMFKARSIDPPSLAIAQDQIAKQIHEWLVQS